MIDGSFDIRDSFRILYVALYGAETRPVAWAWLKTNFAKVAEKSRSDETCGLIESLGNTLWDTVDREELRTFLEPRVKPIDGGSTALARTLETFDVKLSRGRGGTSRPASSSCDRGDASAQDPLAKRRDQTYPAPRRSHRLPSRSTNTATRP